MEIKQKTERQGNREHKGEGKNERKKKNGKGKERRSLCKQYF